MSEARLPVPHLPRGWAWIPLGSLSALEKNALTDGPFGSKLKSEHYRPFGPRVVRLQNIGEGHFKDARAHISENHFASLQKHRIYGGDLAIAVLGEVLPKSCVIPDWLGPAIVKADCIRFKPNPELIAANYLNHAINFHDTRKQTSAIIHGVGRPRLNLFKLKSILIPVAPLNEQVRIAATLDQLFSDLEAGVAALERVRDKLKLYRASVLGAAVEGTLTAEWRAQHPQTETASELLQRILTQRRRGWEEGQLEQFKAKGQEAPKNWKTNYKEPAAPDTSNLPTLPKEWCWASFDQIGDTQGGLQKSPNRAPTKNHYPYLRVANVHRGSLDLSELHRFELTVEELNRLRLEPGDILIVEGNGSRTEIGRCALWKGEITDCVHQNHIIRVRPYCGLLPKYADVFLNSPIGQNAIQLVASSTSGLYTLNISKIKHLPVALAPTIEQEAIVESVEDHLSMIDHLEGDLDGKLKKAQGLRQAVLRHAFTGQLLQQNPNDEPASELLNRIVAERDVRERHATKTKMPKKTKAETS